MPQWPTGNPQGRKAMTDAAFINGLFSHPERMNSEVLYQLRTVVERYPYFRAARVLLLQSLFLLQDVDFERELRRSAFYLSPADRRDLWMFVHGNPHPSPAADTSLSPATDTSLSPVADHTQSIIDTYLQSMPEEPPTPMANTLSATDYLASIGWTTDDEPLDMLVSPDIPEILDNPEIPEKDTPGFPPSLEPLEPLESPAPSISLETGLQPQFLTETLARIYIKQKKYDRALEIIRSLYLNFPEKSIYFADQIRFLEKLVRNNQSKKV